MNIYMCKLFKFYYNFLDVFTKSTVGTLSNLKTDDIYPTTQHKLYPKH